MSIRIITGDCRDVLRSLPAGSAQTCVTSPPYFGLRDYGVAGQIGLEPTPDAFVAEMVAVFREVRRVLADDGTLWLNLGDSYAGSWSGNSMRPDGGAQREGGPGFQPLKDGRYPAKGGKTYGLKPKDLIGIPWRVAFALQADGWYLRSDIIWHKLNPMPESVKDRPTSAHEHIFLLSKRASYFYDAEAIKDPESVPGWDDGSRVYGGVNKHGANAQHGERTTGRVAGPRKRGVPPRHEKYASSDQSGPDEAPRGMGRNKRNVWTVATQPFPDAHFATFPPALIEPCIKAGSRPGDTVLDPFGGAGTTGLVADRLGRDAILTELNPEYAAMAARRIRDEQPMFADVRVEVSA